MLCGRERRCAWACDGPPPAAARHSRLGRACASPAAPWACCLVLPPRPAVPLRCGGRLRRGRPAIGASESSLRSPRPCSDCATACLAEMCRGENLGATSRRRMGREEVLGNASVHKCRRCLPPSRCRKNFAIHQESAKQERQYTYKMWWAITVTISFGCVSLEIELMSLDMYSSIEGCMNRENSTAIRCQNPLENTVLLFIQQPNNLRKLSFDYRGLKLSCGTRPR